MKRHPNPSIITRVCLTLLVILSFFLLAAVSPAQTPQLVVHAVLFVSPTCPHCHIVITETLPPLLDQYGDQLQVLVVDVSQQAGYDLFIATLQRYNIERGGVPFMVIGSQALIGSLDIPEQFPVLVASHLAAGGLDWPSIPGLPEYLAALQATPTVQVLLTPTLSASQSVIATPSQVPPSPQPSPTLDPSIPIFANGTGTTLQDRLARDPIGNGLSIIVLVAMIAVVGWAAWYFTSSPGRRLTPAGSWSIVVLCLVGLAVAAYLAYVETLQVEAICGPIGDCNTVQQSEYARLFGLLPIGLLGVAGYLAILAALLINRLVRGRLADLAVCAVFAMTIAGTLFSIYLTFLEPFVIGATCAWCLTSAVIMTALMLLSLFPAREVCSRWILRYKQ